MNVWGLLLGLAAVAAPVHPAANVAVAATDADPSGERGATLPWVTYEAEQMTTTGSLLGPDYTGQTPAEYRLAVQAR